MNETKYSASRWCSLYWSSNAEIYFNRIELYLWKTLGSLWQYYRDELALGSNAIIIDFPNDNNISISVKFEEEISGQTQNDGKIDI